MNDRKRILLSSILIMSGVAILVAFVVITILYRTALDEQRAVLAEFVKVHARLMEAVARFDAIHSQKDHPQGAAAATLSQIADAHQYYQGFGKTGEIVLARREDDKIIFLFPYRHSDGGDPKPVPWSSSLAEPMRRALSGGSGTMIGLDYRSEPVVAAYEPVAVLNYGVVAKIDVAEIRAPFVTAALISAAGALLVILVGGGLMLRITHPLIRQLGESEARSRAIVDTAEDAIITITERGIIESANPSTTSMFGYQKNELIGEQIYRLMPEPHRKNHPTYLQRYLDTGEKKIIGSRRELAGRRKDQSEFPIELAVAEIQLPNRRLFMGMIRDITERKQSEELVRRTQEKLLKNQRQARAQVEAELEKVRDQLIRHTRLAAIGQLSAGIAHELRNPLGSIRNAAYLLKKYASFEESNFTEELDIISDEVNRSDKIISNLLEISRQKKPIKQHVHLSEIVESAFRNIGATNGVTLRYEPDPCSIDLYADSVQLEQVFENIIRNSIEAMEGAGDILISTSETSQVTTIMIQDNGPGIAADDRDRVFEPLYSNKSTGTGLGLAICRQIIESHDGNIEIIEGTGSGTTTRIILPSVRHEDTLQENSHAESTHGSYRR